MLEDKLPAFELKKLVDISGVVDGIVILHSGKKKLNEPRECLFKRVQSKLIVEK